MLSGVALGGVARVLSGVALGEEARVLSGVALDPCRLAATIRRRCHLLRSIELGLAEAAAAEASACRGLTQPWRRCRLVATIRRRCRLPERLRRRRRLWQLRHCRQLRHWRQHRNRRRAAAEGRLTQGGAAEPAGRRI